jgi:hypothetical protein
MDRTDSAITEIIRLDKKRSWALQKVIKKPMVPKISAAEPDSHHFAEFGSARL